MKIKEWLLRLVLVLLIFSIPLTIGGRERGDFMFLNEIRPGMEGVGKTIVKGETIENFYIKVVDIIDNPGDLFDFILVRVSGGAITRSGGISGGMSGSPIYIDDKLIGALSRSVWWQEGQEPLAWITPIESMLKLVDSVCQQLGSASPVSVSSGSPEVGEEVAVTSRSGRINKVKFVSEPPSSAELQANPRTLYAGDLRLSPLVGGLSERAFNWLKDGLDLRLLEENRDYLLPSLGGEETFRKFQEEMSRGLAERYGQDFMYLSAGTSGTPTSGTLELIPGTSLGALLMSGDDYFGWFGTVTYKEACPEARGEIRNVMVGFGHYMLEAGESHYFLNPVSVLDTVDTLRGPFKIGAPGGIPGAIRIPGAILEDRYQGIAGATGIQTRSIKLNFRVRDNDLGVAEEFHVDIVPMRDLYPVLSLIAGYDAVYTTINRVGAGTMRIRYTIKGWGMPRDLVREDIFVSPWDIALTGPLQIARIAYLLAWNEFQDPEIYEIDVEAEIGKEIRTVVVEGIETDKDIYKPGETIEYAVGLQPYQGELKVIRGTLRIPEKFQGGELKVWALPASWAEAVGAYEIGWTRPMPSAYSFEDLIEDAEELAQNDLLYVLLDGVPTAIWRDCLRNFTCAITDYLNEWDMKDLEIEGAVTGYDYWSIIVMDGDRE